MNWYHTMLCHPGQVRMEQNIKAILLARNEKRYYPAHQNL